MGSEPQCVRLLSYSDSAGEGYCIAIIMIVASN